MTRISVVLACLLLSCEVPKGEAGGSAPAHETVWVGDILLADAAQGYLEEHGHGWPFVHLQSLVVAEALAELRFTAMSLGNNHLLDRGPEGVADTVRLVDDAGVSTFGGGSPAPRSSRS